ncbi:MAG TPA: excinuclease ABC subunit UvrA [Limnochordia bacterium]|nr:excinuclease ABC subunit UvrA [Limnochordia bacterium]
MNAGQIVIRGARQHNLKNVDVEIPRDKLVVFTGLSGSGKSSLAFDTIYAEGQRRYVESLSAYARQFLGQMDKPDVDFIEGLSPAISIDQKTTSRNPRSTVGTVTEIYDYLRLLYARIGTPHCPECGRTVTRQAVEQIVDRVLALPEGTRLQVLAPIVRGRKGEYKKLFDEIRKDGFVRVRVDGQGYEVTDQIPLDKNKKHDIEIVVDRLVVRAGDDGDGLAARAADSIETALKRGDGVVMIDLVDGETLLFSERYACPDCGISLEELAPRMFSFNSPYGACPGCDGLGTKLEFDPELILDLRKGYRDGGIVPWSGSQSKWLWALLDAVAADYDIDPGTPTGQLTERQRQVLLHGTGGRKTTFKYTNKQGHSRTFESVYEGVVAHLERRLRESGSSGVRADVEQYMTARPCAECKGKRLKREVLAVTFADRSIAEVTGLSVAEAHRFFAQVELDERQQLIAHQVLKEIRARLGFLVNVGLEYLTLDREAGSLSGGEAQRIRLATQVGSSLVGVLYILDEPSIGLHQRDNQRLLDTLKGLRDIGNTLVVVEHDEDTIRQADYVVDIGPGAGEHGGRIVAAGTPEEIARHPESITGAYLSGRRRIHAPGARRTPSGWLKLRGAREHNLRGVDVDFPLGVFCCVTGVSGSGKSTLVTEVLQKRLLHEVHGRSLRPGAHDALTGIEQIDKVIDIDQSPIGRTPRSNPATYTGTFDLIRDLFAQSPESKIRGYQAGRFSFNVKGGRCESCKGDGMIKIEMHFLPDVYVPCEVCKGRRYNRETLQVKYKGKSIADVLDLTIEEANAFFAPIPRIHRRIQTMFEVGLGYMRLGQPATTLSGGEAQRVKLATELARRSTNTTLYILDEPTTGLHAADIQKLLDVLQQLVEQGNSVLVIEHNLDVIKTADYIIDLGPEGGNRGGQVIATGTPEQLAATDASYTGRFLRQVLDQPVPAVG